MGHFGPTHHISGSKFVHPHPFHSPLPSLYDAYTPLTHALDVPLTKRRLTTVFCADVDGYTQLMARDEEATLARLQRCRERMRDLFSQHHGREINTWGDAVIAEFDSVVEAVRCGIAVQDAVETENLSSDAKPMRFRIGINLGDVIDDGSSVYGDGVNTAARLESACEPGAVLVSDTVHSLVYKQLAVRFERLEDAESKPGEESVSGYLIERDRSNAPKEADTAPVFIPSSNTALGKTSGFLSRLDNWIKGQPRIVRIACGVMLFLFAINLVTTGLSPPWFVFPSIPLALVVFLAGG